MPVNQQEELQVIMLLENNGVTAITETWWDNSHDWTVPVSGY